MANRVTMTICGQDYTLVADESAAYMEKVGALVVEKANALKEGAAFTLSSEHRELEGGLLLKKGLVEINCSFATQLRLLRQDMAADVAAILFS